MPKSTTLNLLTRDGAVHVTFTPALNAEQYAQLMRVVSEGHDGDNAAQLTDVLQNLATSWGCTVTVDPC